MLEDIRDFRRLSARCLTAGQPTAAQLADAAAEGVQVVINLALPSSDHALPDERAEVERLGMRYEHIPVHFDSPREDELEQFSDLVDSLSGRKIFIHCAANKRVSAFVALHRVRRLGWPADKALEEMYTVWEPDEVWRDFITASLPTMRISRSPKAQS